MLQSTIVTSLDLEFAKQAMEQRLSGEFVKRHYVDEFKVDDAKEVIREAYIAEERTKYILLSAFSFNIYAQNALLKLLEEPPRNIVFVIIAKSKTSLLPTIRSRMKVEHIEAQKSVYDLGLNINNIGLEELFAFLKTHKSASKEELKEIIQATLLNVVKTPHIRLTSSELDMFDKALELAELNARPQHILSYLLLTVLQADMRGRR